MNSKRTFCRRLGIIGLGCVLTLPAQSDPTFYTDESAFQSAFPGLPVEDFENCGVTAGNFAICTFDPLSSTVNYCGGLCGTPANVLPGFAIGATDAINTTIVSNGAAAVGNTTVAIGPNGLVRLRVVFSGGTSPAVGMNVISGLVPGNQPITVEAYDSSNTLLGSTTISAADGAGTFVGIADLFTARIDLVPASSPAQDQSLPFLDNLRFEILSITTDLRINKSGQNDGNGFATYVLTVANAGPDDEVAAQVVDTLPPGVQYLSDTCGMDTNGLPTTLLWDIGALAAGDSVQCTIAVAITDLGQTENTAQVTGFGDPEGSTVRASIPFEIPALHRLSLLALASAIAGMAFFNLWLRQKA